jgi:hypothetical protein
VFNGRGYMMNCSKQQRRAFVDEIIKKNSDYMEMLDEIVDSNMQHCMIQEDKVIKRLGAKYMQIIINKIVRRYISK